MDLLTAVAASLLPASRGAIAAAFRSLLHEPSSGAPFLELLSDVAGARDVSGAAIREALEQAEDALRRAVPLGITPIALVDPAYPRLLAEIFDPPPVLWVRGAAEQLSGPAVAVVGSRAATPYALEVAARLGAELAERSIAVVSGMARGVDSAAHRGCLGAGGVTFAVLGCGPDRVYPAEHADLAEAACRRGAVLAELAPGAPPLPHHFPLRNRIISGISLATVVVEASEQSGSLITARCALEQGREVMVVPGSVLSGRNRGSHALLKDGAAIVECADDILQGIGLPAPSRPTQPFPCQASPLLAVMDPGESYDLDALAAAAGLPGPAVLAALTTLELRGIVTARGGRYVRRG